MSSRGDILGGVILVLIGLTVVVHSTLHMQIGTLVRMGPGMFPTMLGVVLALFGAIIALSALKAEEAFPDFAWRPLFAVLASLVAFAVLVGPAGIIVAIAALIVIVSRSGSAVSLLTGALMVGVLSVIVIAMIHFFTLPIKILPW